MARISVRRQAVGITSRDAFVQLFGPVECGRRELNERAAKDHRVVGVVSESHGTNPCCESITSRDWML
jgi:hypothetical protein